MHFIVSSCRNANNTPMKPMQHPWSGVSGGMHQSTDYPTYADHTDLEQPWSQPPPGPRAPSFPPVPYVTPIHQVPPQYFNLSAPFEAGTSNTKKKTLRKVPRRTESYSQAEDKGLYSVY